MRVARSKVNHDALRCIYPFTKILTLIHSKKVDSASHEYTTASCRSQASLRDQ